MRDHLEVDVVFTKSREHASCDTNHVLHLSTNQTQNCHIGEYAHITTFSKLLGGLAKSLDLLAARMNGHRNVHLGGGNEIDRDGVVVEDGKDTGEEAVRDRSLIRVHVNDANVVLDGNGSRSLGFSVVGFRLGSGRAACKLVASSAHAIRNNNGAVPTRILDILDADRNRRLSADDLVHGKMVNDL